MKPEALVARAAILSNGSMAVGLDENGLIHDFYYPYVGLENMTNARSLPHYIGVWIDGVFSWLHDDAWKNSVVLSDTDMRTTSTHVNHESAMTLTINTIVDPHTNMLIRNVRIDNQTEHSREVRLFFHQVFQISADGRADTALYEPNGHYVVDYKGRVTILANACTDRDESFDQYAVGNYGIEGKAGTYMDAEDGELSMCAVEHAGVDSVLRVSTTVAPSSSRTVYYWLLVSDSQYHVHRANEPINTVELAKRFDDNKLYWQLWLKPAEERLAALDDVHRHAVVRSLFTIKAHCDKHGGVIASCDSSIYNYGRDYYSYVWPRDGALALWPLLRMGIFDEAKRFFMFCRDIISVDGYMMHKYQPDKAVGSTWHPLVHGSVTELAIQEDETALVIFMLGEYLDYSDDEDFVLSLYDGLIKPAADFMSSFVDEQTGLPHASYDLWEEKFLTSTFSSSATYKALMVAAQTAELAGQQTDASRWQAVANTIKSHSAVFYDPEREALRKGYLLAQDGSLQLDNTLDISSVYGAVMFDYVDDKQQIVKTIRLIESELLDRSPSGGTPRYEDDAYFRSEQPYRGNPWFVTTLWMAQLYAQAGQLQHTQHYITWALDHALPSGALSEQINPADGSVVGVTPLVWSHAELINTILDYDDQRSA